MKKSAVSHYPLYMLTAVYAISMLDRGLLFMLLEPIKHDLKLSDTQLGFLTSIAFGIFYATLGVPIARWSDRDHRVNIVALAMAVWGATAMACLFVTNFVQLATARLAAAIGDSGAKPPIYSLIGDYYPEPAARTRALYIFEAAVPISTLASFATAGWLNAHIGWRMTLFLIGIPGLLLAILVKLTVREPVRQGVSRIAASGASLSLAQVFLVMWRRPSCRHLTIAMILTFTMSVGLAAWQVSFMMRSHGADTATLGLWMGLIYGGGGLAGLLFGARVLQRWIPDDAGAQMKLAAVAIALSLPCFLGFLLAASPTAALACLLPQAILFNAFLPATFALLQRLVPNEQRASALMIMLLFANLVGMGVGPQIVGIMSDTLHAWRGETGLRDAMMVMTLLAPWAAFHLWRVSSSINGDIVRVEQAIAGLEPQPSHG